MNTIGHCEDKEGLSWDKITWFLYVVWKRDLGEQIPYRLEKIGDLDIAELQSHYNNQVKGILLDLDDCTTPAYAYIEIETILKINKILSGHEIVAGVNSSGINVEQRTEQLINFINCTPENKKLKKPSKQNFLAACEKLGVDPRHTVMIGDDISKDGGALQLAEDGKPILLGYVHVKPIGNSYRNIAGISKKINYFFKVITRWIANKSNGL